MILSAAALTASAEGEYRVNAYGSEDACSDSNIPLGSTVGIRLNLTAPFKGLSVRLSTYLQSDSIATVSLYKWAGDFESTLKTAPLTEKTFNPVLDNKKHDMEFETQPAGEYLIGVRNDNSQLCVWAWKSTNDVGKGLFYSGGSESAYDINVTVTFTEKTDEPFKKVTPANGITGSGPGSSSPWRAGRCRALPRRASQSSPMAARPCWGTSLSRPALPGCWRP